MTAWVAVVIGIVAVVLVLAVLGRAAALMENGGME